MKKLIEHLIVAVTVGFDQDNKLFFIKNRGTIGNISSQIFLNLTVMCIIRNVMSEIDTSDMIKRIAFQMTPLNA